MQSRFHPMFYVILPLAVLGFAYQFDALLSSLMIPIAIIAVLFVLYFVMQKRSARPRYSRPARKQARKPEKPSPKRRSSPFRVIDGRKNRDDEDPPHYH